MEESIMRSKKLLALLIAPLFAVGMAACDVDQTQEGDLPDVEVEEGQLPAYDVDTDIEVTEDTVIVPDVDIPDEPEGDGGTTGGGDTR
jgi:hypothetical protein